MKNELPTKDRRPSGNTWLDALTGATGHVRRKTPRPNSGPRHPIPPGTIARRTANELPYGLTPAEMAIIEAIEDGASNLEIAKRRNCAVGTVKVHLGRIFRKLGVRSRGGVIAMIKIIHALLQARAGRVQPSPFRREWIEPDMTIENRCAGTLLFRRGDPADAIYYLEEGRIDLPEVEAFLEAGDLFGEIGVFAEDGRRTASAYCETPVRLLRVSADSAWHLYYRNPSFAAHVLRLAATRIMSERARRFDGDGMTRTEDSPELVTT